MPLLEQLSRWAKSHQNLLSALLIVASVLVVFNQELFFGKAIVDNFTLHHQYAPLSFIAKEIQNGNRPPLWLDGYSNGYGYWMSAFAYFPPLTLLFHLVDFLTGFHILLMLSFITGGLLSFWFLRALRLSPHAALLGAFVYIWSQISMSYALLPLTLVLPLVPGLFLSVYKIMEGKYRFLFLGVPLLWLGWMSVFSEYVVHTSGFAILFALFLAHRKNYKKLGVVFSLFFLGTLFALPRLLAIAQFVPVSARAAGAQGVTDFFTGSDVISLLFPYFSLPFSSTIPFFHNNPFTIYVGIVPLILFVIFITQYQIVTKEKRYVWFFAGLFLFSFLMLIKWSGLFFIVRLATGSLFGGAWKLLYIGYFSLGVVSAATVDSWSEWAATPRAKTVWRYTRAALLFVFFLIVCGEIGITVFKSAIIHIVSSHVPGNSGHQAALAETFVTGLQHTISLTNLQFSIPLAALIGTIIFLENPLGLLVIALITPVLLWQGYYGTVPRTVVDTAPQTAQFLHTASKEPFRVMRFFPSRSDYTALGLPEDNLLLNVELEKELLTPNLNVVYGISTVDGDDNFMSLRQAKLQAILGSFRAPQQDKLKWIAASSTLQEKTARFSGEANQHLLGVTNTKYILTSFPFPAPWKKQFETRLPGSNMPVLVYENPTVAPRVYFPGIVTTMAPNESAALLAVETISVPGVQAVIECSTAECLAFQGTGAPTDRVIIESIHSGTLRLKTTTTHPRFLVYTESTIPGWHATIDERPTSIYTANYVYQAIIVPAGTHTIIFTYRSLLN